MSLSSRNLRCDHCGLEIEPGKQIRTETNGAARFFCCHGCHGAFTIIHGAGLDDFYRKRRWGFSGVPKGAFENRYDEDFLASLTSHSDEGSAMDLFIDGIRCATCVWLIEKIVTRMDGIKSVRTNFATHVTRIVFNNDVVSPVAIIQGISALGYLPRPAPEDAPGRILDKEFSSVLIRFGTAAFFSLQLMGFSIALYAGFFQGMDRQSRLLLQLLAAAVAVPVIFYSGFPFIHGALRSIKNRAPSMDTLVATGVLAAFVLSLANILKGGEVYFDTAAMIVTLVLLGRLMEAAARRRAARSLASLMQLAPERATLITAHGDMIVAADHLKKNDLVRVLPGDRFPADGVIMSGETEIDESIRTGESMPVAAKKGDHVFSGGINCSAVVEIRLTCPASESFHARISHMIAEAQARQPPVQRLADRVAARFVPVVFLLSLATAMGWWSMGATVDNALLHAVAVLVVACPCALGLATPLAVVAAVSNAARQGILFKGGDVLEAAAGINTVALDKTGTLTCGTPLVTAIHAGALPENELILIAASAEKGSNHPIAQAIIREADLRQINIPLCETLTVPGKGIQSSYKKNTTLVGNAGFLSAAGVQVPDIATDSTLVHIAVGSTYAGSFELADSPRPEAQQVVSSLMRMGLDPVLLTGDSKQPAMRIAQDLGIKEYHASMVPEEKAGWIQQKIKKGGKVLMAGDGINDAPALAEATVGCAVTGATDIAAVTSDMVLTAPSLTRLYDGLVLAQKSMRVIRQNLFWAFLYNILAIPMAIIGILAPIHAAVAMAASSLFVVANSLRINIRSQGLAGTP